MVASIVKLLEAIRITDKKGASLVSEYTAWAYELAIPLAFFAPLLNKFPKRIDVLNTLKLVWNRIFNGEDVIIFSHCQATDVVELPLTSDAVATPLIKKASTGVEMLHTVRIHISDDNGVIGKRVDIGDGVELALPDPFSTTDKLLLTSAGKACVAKRIGDPKVVVGIDGNCGCLEALCWNFAEHFSALVDLCNYWFCGCVPKGAIGCDCNVSDRLG